MLRQIHTLLLALIFMFYAQGLLAEDFPKKEPGYSASMSRINHDLINGALNKSLDVNKPDEKGATALIHASTLGDIGKIIRLVELGADINYRKNNGGTALISAAQMGRSEVVQTLIDLGASTDLRATIKGKRSDGADMTYTLDAVYQAVAFQYPKTLETLLLNGANANPDLTLKPLSTAYRAKNSQIFDLLLEYGADPNTTMTRLVDGRPQPVPLVSIVQSENNTIFLNKLKAAGAYIPKSTGQGHNAVKSNAAKLLEIAKFNGYVNSGDFKAARAFIDRTANFQLLEAPGLDMRLSSISLIASLKTKTPSADFAEFLLLNGADVNATKPLDSRAYNNPNAYTPMLANINGLKHLEEVDKGLRDKVRNERLKILQILLDYGAEVYDPNLIYEAYLRDMEFAERIIKAGAEPNPVLNTGKTVIQTLEEKHQDIQNKLNTL